MTSLSRGCTASRHIDAWCTAIIDAWCTALSHTDARCTSCTEPWMHSIEPWCTGLRHNFDVWCKLVSQIEPLLMPDAQHWATYWCLIALSHGCTALSDNYACMIQQYWAILMPYSQHWAILMFNAQHWAILMPDDVLSQPDYKLQILVTEQEPARCMLHCMPTWQSGVPG